MSGVRQLLRMLPIYAKLAWWGLVSPHRERCPLVVHQGVVLDVDRVLLSVRSDLCGWELPGGNPDPGESGEATLRREILEETGVEVEVERRVGDYVRRGFRLCDIHRRPHLGARQQRRLAVPGGGGTHHGQHRIILIL